MTEPSRLPVVRQLPSLPSLPSLPVPSPAPALARVARGPLDLVRRRLSGAYEVDEYGLDPDFAALVEPLLRLRWSIEVDGAERIPAEGPAVLVVNRRFGLSEPAVVAAGLARRTGRPIRFLGVPDLAPIAPLLRRLGGALDRPDELAGLLRAGNVVCVLSSTTPRRRERAGRLALGALAPAVALGAPVLPVAAVGRELGRAWRVAVGDPVEPPEGRGPLAVAQLADATRAALQDLLDEAYPPRWLW